MDGTKADTNRIMSKRDFRIITYRKFAQDFFVDFLLLKLEND